MAQRYRIAHTAMVAVGVEFGLEADCIGSPWGAVVDWSGFAAGNRSPVRAGLSMEPVSADSVSRLVT